MARKWYTRLRNLVLIKKLNENQLNNKKLESNSNTEIFLSEQTNNILINPALKIENALNNVPKTCRRVEILDKDFNKLKEIRNKKRLSPKIYK